jgi:hypothetical protein
MNRRNLFWSSAHGLRIALAKERALHAYRDQERIALGQAADIAAREGRLHLLVRAWRFEPIGLRAPEHGAPVLDRWDASVTRHNSSPADPPFEIDDPRKRTVESTLTDLAADPKGLT